MMEQQYSQCRRSILPMPEKLLPMPEQYTPNAGVLLPMAEYYSQCRSITPNAEIVLPMPEYSSIPNAGVQYQYNGRLGSQAVNIQQGIPYYIVQSSPAYKDKRPPRHLRFFAVDWRARCGGTPFYDTTTAGFGKHRKNIGEESFLLSKIERGCSSPLFSLGTINQVSEEESNSLSSPQQPSIYADVTLQRIPRGSPEDPLRIPLRIPLVPGV